MLGMRLRPWVVLAGCALSACAGGAAGPSTTSAFDPNAGSDTGTGTTTGTGTGSDPDAGMTTLPSPDSTGDPTPDASCCQVAATPGCGNQEIEMCVCTLEPTCCQDVWRQDCVDLAIDPCADPACAMPGSTSEPGESSSSSGGPVAISCEELAAQEGWMYFRCQNGDIQCGNMGTPTTDCDYCCGYCNDAGDVSCGGLADMNGWGMASCEWNGNGACGGSGTPTCDCDFCCEVN